MDVHYLIITLSIFFLTYYCKLSINNEGITSGITLAGDWCLLLFFL